MYYLREYITQNEKIDKIPAEDIDYTLEVLSKVIDILGLKGTNPSIIDHCRFDG